MALAAALMLGAGAATAAAPTGVIAQKQGRAGCLSKTATGGACARGRALERTSGIALSADGRSAYVASPIVGLAVLDRDPAGGALTQKAGQAGCISDLEGGCVESVSATAEYAVAVSPDDKSVYSGGLDGLTVLDRDAASGAIVQKPGAAGCLDRKTAGCTRVRAIDWPDAITISPDGLNVYVGSGFNGLLTIFDRDATGALRLKAGRDGCLSVNGSGGRCARGRFDSVGSVTISPDGRSVYVGSDDGITVFDRLPGGALRRKPGRAGCVTESGSRGRCANGKVVKGVSSATISADGRSLYTAGSAVASFDRDIATGALTQKRGPGACISGSGDGGRCTNGKALFRLRRIAISADGLSVYVTGRDAVAVFDRDTTTGTLRQKRKLAGCVADGGMRGLCATAKALRRPDWVTVSSDGANVYVGADASSAVAIFDRR